MDNFMNNVYTVTDYVVLDAVLAATPYVGDKFRVNSETDYRTGAIKRVFTTSNEYSLSKVVVRFDRNGAVHRASVDQYAREDGAWVPNSGYRLTSDLASVIGALFEESGNSVD